ncbi:MAG: BTAD domain-containing putative transcriptional regulator [Anaerolineae bacterium]|nr:BTAD domain-containing putative transcriptional regulator [Anaerolineae bacterium]
MPRLSLQLLGPFHATLDEKTISGFETNKVRALLAYLAVESDHPHNRETLAGMLWPDIAESNARRNLRHNLYNLRQVIRDYDADPPFLLINRQTIQFNPASDVQLDVKVFTEAMAATHDHPHDNLETCEVCEFLLAEAEQRYGGDFLMGFSLPSDLFETWVVVQRERLHIQILDLLDHLAAYNENKENFTRAQYYARRQIELEPWREHAHRQMMRIYIRNGQRGMALAQYESCRQILVRELAIEPEPETIDLYEQIHAREYENTGIIPTPEDDTPRKEDQPLPNNLPSTLTTFVERTAIANEILARLSEPASRLVTLFGPGGSGKTRLALETARVVLSKVDPYGFTDGLYYIPLAAVASIDEMVSTIAQTLDFTFLGEDKPYDQLLDNLREKNLLLILDNFEHLVNHTRIVIDILRAAPRVKILVTSRVKLNLPAEHLVRISGMSYPSSSHKQIDPSDFNAIKLFLQSARRVKREFALTADNTPAVILLCQLVRGMPIAILLATAWLDTLSLSDITREIERSLDILDVDWQAVPERQRSMRAVFDHSWRLLNEREREIMCGLSVFRGGCTWEAAQAMTGATLRDLLGLINKSQLHRTPDGRYEIHELLRQYAEARLTEQPEVGKVARDRHSAFYALNLARWERELKGLRQHQATVEITVDYENILSALDWMVDNEEIRMLEHAVNALCMHFVLLNRYHECVQLTETLAGNLREVSGIEGHKVLARVVAWQAYMTEQTGDYEGGLNTVRESFSILGLEDVLEGKNQNPVPPVSDADQSLRAFTYWVAGHCYWQREPKRTMWFFKESLAMYRELGDRWFTEQLLRSLAQCYRTLEGLSEKMVPLLKESMEISQSLGDYRGMMGNYTILAVCMIYLGCIREGDKFLTLAQAVADESGVSRYIFDLFQVFFVKLLLGRYDDPQKVDHMLSESKVQK